MASSHRFTLIGLSAACALVALSAIAHAQNVDCKKTETKPECHARLQCNPDEELEACQKRLLRCAADEELEECKKRRRGGGADDDRARDDRRDRDDDRGRDDRRDRDDDRGRDDRRDRDDDDDDRARDDRRGRDDDARERRRRGGGRGDARGRRGGGGGGGHGFEANKTFGLGLELGEPTGLNGKFFFSEKAAFDFGVGWIYRHYYYDDGLHIYGDFLYHPVSLASADAFELPLYIGVGLRFWEFEYCYMNTCGFDGSVVGLRIPIGISFDFNTAPLDIFLQLVPVIDFVDDDYADRYGDDTHTGIDVSAGFRFWFK